MTKMLVLGSRGMLGSMVLRVLSNLPSLTVVGTIQAAEQAPQHSGPGWLLPFNALCPESLLRDLFRYGGWPDFIINCVGKIKPAIDGLDPDSVAQAIEVNSTFPHRLAAMAAGKSQIIHITTDCVFTGQDGAYNERACHDADDHYGKTKSLGEVVADNVMNLRCSIIGPELSRPTRSLLEWVIGQKMGAIIGGYTNHLWNGLTTLHFAHICGGIAANPHLFRPGVQHLIPQDHATKFDLLQHIAAAWNRDDITVEAREVGDSCHRNLATLHPSANAYLWAAAGYPVPPTVAQMVRELADFKGMAPLTWPV